MSPRYKNYNFGNNEGGGLGFRCLKIFVPSLLFSTHSAPQLLFSKVSLLRFWNFLDFSWEKWAKYQIISAFCWFYGSLEWQALESSSFLYCKIFIILALFVNFKNILLFFCPSLHWFKNCISFTIFSLEECSKVTYNVWNHPSYINNKNTKSATFPSIFYIFL